MHLPIPLVGEKQGTLFCRFWMLPHSILSYKVGRGKVSDKTSDAFSEVYLLVRRMLGQIQK
jgi:hypothetical protein